jgi:protocatechuate 3,4-dioxygenase beta subunit
VTVTNGVAGDTYQRAEGVHPPLAYEPYGSSRLRAPSRSPLVIPQTVTELTGPALGERDLDNLDADLTRQHAGEPLGERIIVHGRVLDGSGRPIPNTLVEVWQANAAGRYHHDLDRHPTDAEGRYRFVTVKPGAYPWKNHHNAWRPAHIHFSLFGRAFVQRLVTQMYFPGDPLFYQDPIFNSVPDPRVRERMIARFDLDATEPEWALGYQWDIVLRGPTATVFEPEDDDD